jgi:hypothetical protein
MAVYFLLSWRCGMKVIFKNVESALSYGAPSFKEQQAILALDRRDVLSAKIILDEVIASNPDRVKNIYMYRGEGVADAPMHKYIVQTATPAQIGRAINPFSSRVDGFNNVAAPPPYKDSDPTSLPPENNRDANGEDRPGAGDAALVPHSVKDKPEGGIRHRKMGLLPEKWRKEAKDDLKPVQDFRDPRLPKSGEELRGQKIESAVVSERSSPFRMNGCTWRAVPAKESLTKGDPLADL